MDRYPHQIAAAQQGILQGSMGLYMGMRTGKSRTAYDIIKGRAAMPCLIICPLGVIAAWVAELRLLGVPWDHIKIIRPPSSKTAIYAKNRLLDTRARFFIVNFETVDLLDALNVRSQWAPDHTKVMELYGVSAPFRAPEYFQLPDWRGIIIDECYRIANPENKLTQYLLERPHPGIGVQTRLCLSGTPAAESPHQYATQFLFMDGVYFGCTTPAEYLLKYWVWNEQKLRYFPKDKQHLEDIRKYVQKRAYCVTMEELGLGCQILHTTREVEANEKQKELQYWIENCTTYKQKKTGQLAPMEPAVRSLYAHQIAAGIDPTTGEMISDNKILDWVEYWEVDKRPLLVSSRFLPPLHRALEICQQRGMRAAIIWSGVQDTERENIRLQFQNGELDIVLGQEKTIYRGLDFSGLSDLVVMSAGYAAEVWEQLIERGQHVNRTVPYQIINQHTVGSIDKRITNVLTNKELESTFYLERGAGFLDRLLAAELTKHPGV